MVRLIASFLAVFLTACTTVSAPPVTDAVDAAPVAQLEYRIGVDDQVDVNVWKNPELSVSIPVRPDGMISVPLIGDIKVGGKTPTEVSSHIKDRLSEYILNPDVTVIISALRSQEFHNRVRITGAIATPTSINYRPGMTVLDLVLEAGGVNEFASSDNTRIYRKVGGVTKALEVKLDRILKKGDMSTNYDLHPGDVITVPERFF